MPTTSRGYHYPAASDAPNVPSDIGALAADLNTDVGSIDTRVAILEGKVVNAAFSQVAGQSIANGGVGAVLAYDTTVSNPSAVSQAGGVITVPTGKTWALITAYVSFALVAAPAGFRLAQIRRNGTVIAGSRPGVNSIANQPTDLSIAIGYPVSAGQTIDLFLFQNQGVAINATGVLSVQFM
jgi:hypothetical protein